MNDRAPKFVGVRFAKAGALQLASSGAFLFCLMLSISSLASLRGFAENRVHVQQAGRVGDQGETDPALTDAKSMIRQRKHAEAEILLRNYLREHDGSAKAHVLLGLVMFEENRPADSLAELTHAAHLSQPDASELVVVALDYVKLRDLPNADRWMSVALQKAPKSAAAWRYMGGIKYSEKWLGDLAAARWPVYGSWQGPRSVGSSHSAGSYPRSRRAFHNQKARLPPRWCRVSSLR